MNKFIEYIKAHIKTWDAKFAFSVWRTLWGSIITILSFTNVLMLKSFFKENPDIEIHNYYDSFTYYLIVAITILVTIDMICLMFVKGLYNFQIVLHHMIMIGLLIAIFNVDVPHHYYASMFMTTEVVTFTTILPQYAKRKADKQQSERYYRMYLLLYIALTIFCRGYVWCKLLYYALTSHIAHYYCAIGVLPLLVLDIYWIKDCVFKFFESKYAKKSDYKH